MVSEFGATSELIWVFAVLKNNKFKEATVLPVSGLVEGIIASTDTVYELPAVAANSWAATEFAPLTTNDSPRCRHIAG